jgi:hypothetical protein
MTFIRKLVGVLCLAFYSLCSNAQTVTHQISDDGYTNVPLQFEFPFYNQTFDNSWMFSNGVISFIDPQQSGMAWQNLSVQPFNTQMGSAFDYSIYPLWTDLINLGGSFTTQGTKEFQRYNWNAISPYADSSRINTFSVEIRPDGKIYTNYFAISVNYGGIGTVGNSSLGEFTQVSYFNGYTTSLPEWNAVAEPSDPCTDNPLANSSCPGYQEAYIAQQCLIDSLYSQQCSGYAEAYLEQQCNNSALYSPKCSGYGAAIALRLLSTDTTEEISVLNTAEESTQAPAQDQQISADSSQEQPQSVVEKSSAKPSTVNARALAQLASQQALDIATQVLENTVIISDQQAIQNFSSREDVADNLDQTATNSLLDALHQSNLLEAIQSDSVTVAEVGRSLSKPAEISGGPDPKALAIAPAGFADYLNQQLKDVQFYKITEAYKHQRTVDNQRLLRGLAGGSDRRHQDMVDAQYK